MIIIYDLSSYGRSTKATSTDGSHAAHSKKAVATDLVGLVDSLFGPAQQFVVVGHDRGARVGYRMAKDYPERVIGLCLQDIVPTKVVFDRASRPELPSDVLLHNLTLAAQI